MLEYSDVCWRKLTYPDVYWRMLTYVDVRWRAHQSKSCSIRFFWNTQSRDVRWLKPYNYVVVSRRITPRDQEAGVRWLKPYNYGSRRVERSTGRSLRYVVISRRDTSWYSRDQEVHECSTGRGKLCCVSKRLGGRHVCWRMLSYDDVCWRMLTYADVCWRMGTYVDVWWRILTYVDVCWRMLTYADVCGRMLRYADVWWHMMTYDVFKRETVLCVNATGSQVCH